MQESDQLTYIVRFERDDQSYSDIKSSIRELEQLKQKAGGQEASDANDEWDESIRRVNKSNLQGIERLVELQREIDSYKDTLKTVRRQKRQNNEEGEQARRTEQETSVALKTATKEYRDQQTAVVANTSAVGEGAATYAMLSAQNRDLARQMKELPLDDKTGKLAKLKQEWRENNEVLKGFDAELGDHRRNVGNYSESISVAASGIAAFQGPLGPIAGRLNSLNSTIQRAIPLLRAKAASWGLVGTAMAATGIPLIAGALFFLVRALRSSQRVTDAVAQRWEQLAAVVGNITERVGSFLGILEGTNEGLGEAAQRARQVRQEKVALEEQTIKNTVVEAEYEAQIAKLRREAEDETNSHADRIQMMEEALDKTNDLFDTRIELQEREIENMKLSMEGTEDDREAKQELADAQAELIRLQAQQDTQSRQLVRRRQSIINQQQVEIERRNRIIEGLKEERREAVKTANAIIDASRRQAREVLDEAIFDKEIQRLRRHGKDRKIIELEYQRDKRQIQKEFAELEAELLEEKENFITAFKKKERKKRLDDEKISNMASVKAEQKYSAKIESERDKIKDVVQEKNDEILELIRDHERAQKEDGHPATLAFINEQIEKKRAEQIDIMNQGDEDIRQLEDEKNEFIRQETKRLHDDNLNEEQIHSNAIIAWNEQVGIRMEEVQENINKRIEALNIERRESLNEIERQADADRLDAMADHNDVMVRHMQEQAIREFAIESNRDERILLLENERGQRRLELQDQYIQKGFDKEQAARMARERAEVEFEQRLFDTKQAIADQQLQNAIDRENALLDIAGAGAQIFFEDNKVAAISIAAVEALLSAIRARTQAPLGTKNLVFAQELAVGAANVAAISRMNFGDSSVESGSESGGLTRRFDVVDRDEEDLASQVAEQEEPEQARTVIELSGDLDSELLAIKAREGNREIDTGTVTVSSRRRLNANA